MNPSQPAVAESTDRHSGDLGQHRASQRPSSFRYEVLTTGAGQVGAALGMVMLYRLLALNTGPEGFASFALVRQAAWLAFPVVMVGIAGGLPRAIGIGARPAQTYLLAGLLITGAATAAATALMLAVPHETAAVAFGDSQRAQLVGPFAALLAATSAYTLAYGYFRGLRRARRAVILQISALALAPVVVVAAFSQRPVEDMINLIAILLGGLSAVVIIVALARAGALITRPSLDGALHELWIYGFRRVAGELAQIALVVAAPIVVAHVDNVRSVAYLVAGQQLLVLLAFLILPLGFVVLPTLSGLWESDRERGRWFGTQLTALGLHAALFITLQVCVFGPLIVRIWLGPRFGDAAPVIRVTALPAGAYVCYLCVRSSLDAVAVKSYNSRNNLIALAMFAAVTTSLLWLAPIEPVLGVAWGLASGLLVQGILAFVTARRIFTIDWSELHAGAALAISLAAGTAALALRPLIGASVLGLITIAALELAMLAIYLFALLRAGVQWPRMLSRRGSVVTGSTTAL